MFCSERTGIELQGESNEELKIYGIPIPKIDLAVSSFGQRLNYSHSAYHRIFCNRQWRNLMKPTIIKQITDQDEILSEIYSKVIRVISEETARTVRNAGRRCIGRNRKMLARIPYRR